MHFPTAATKISPSLHAGTHPSRAFVLGAAAALLLSASPALALDPASPLEQLGHDAWPDSLPQNSVSAILQTRDGYLWLGTYEGLVRFNGVDFRVYDRRDTPNLSSNSVVALGEDRAGRLLVGTMGGGLVRREKGSFQALTSKGGLPSDSVFALAVRGDDVWAGTGNGVARVVDGASRVAETLLPGRMVRSILAAKDGTLWLGTTSEGLYRLKDGVLTHLGRSEGLPHDDVEAFAEEADGTVWIGTYGGGLVSWKDGRMAVFTTRNGLPIDLVYSLLVDRAGTLWVGTDTGGLVRCRGGTFERFDASEPIAHSFVRTLHEDREGSLWIGSNAGIDRLKDQKLEGFTKRSGLSSASVRSLCQGEDGAVYAGGEEGVDVFSGGRFHPVPEAAHLPNRYVRALFSDRKGTLWMATNGGGLAAVRDGKTTVYTTADGLGSNVPNCVFEDRKGTLWVGMYAGGLSRLENGRFVTLGAKDGLTNLNVRCLAEDRHGDLWIGTDEGLFRRHAGALTRLGTAQGLADPVVLVVHEDRDGVLWFATGGGLQRYDGTSLATLTVDRGLPSDKFFQILEDDEDRFWMSSNRGLFAAARRDLVAAAEGRLARVSGLVFSKTDGMPSTQCNGATQPAGFRARDGRLWFPTFSGAVRVDPARLRRNAVPPPVAVDAVLVDGKPADLAGDVVLPAGAETIEVKYDGLSLTAPEKVRFRYRLQSFDDAWVDAGTRRSAFYTHLPPGRYRFEVTACNDDGLFARAPAGLDLVKRPHLHQTLGFRALGLFLLGGAVLAVHAARTRRLRAREKELEELVAKRTATLEQALLEAERHEKNAEKAMSRAEEASRLKSAFLATTSHELRTPLNAIIGYSELLHEEARERKDLGWQADLQKIHQAGQHLLELINSILDLSKLEAGKMELALDSFEVPALVEEVVVLVRPLVERGGNVLEWEVAPGVGSFLGDRIRTKQILLNLLSNAAKFTEEGRVTFRVDRVSGALRFVVSDTGIGMAPEQIERLFLPFVQADATTTRRYGGTGLGLALSKRFADLMGGTIAVSSELGKGTTFTFLLPERKTFFERG